MNRTFTHGPALFRRMGIPMSPVDPRRRGLVIIQIDGLSHKRLIKALKTRRLRFLRKMLKTHKFRLQKYLSEIPTSTPAFQGGMFYGDNDNIPGFSFYDKVEKRVYRMGDSDCAYAVETSFRNQGLLRDGSVFSSVYRGGAEASLFIFSSLLAPTRWKFVFRAWDILLLSVLNIRLIFKLMYQSVVEMAVGFYDMIKRVAQHGHLKREFEIVGIRIGLSLISRELITLGAVIDVFRRVPVIYVNYLSYDEHSHLRGPDSRFAMWTLRDIDHNIRKIYRATRFSERDYDFYVLSDHGQVKVRPFELVAGETLAEFLQGQLTNMVVENYRFKNQRIAELVVAAHGTNRLVQSMPWLFRLPVRMYSTYLHRQLEESQGMTHLTAMLDVSVVSTGPIAYAYWTQFKESLTRERLEEMHPGLIEQIASHPAVSFVSVRCENGAVYVRSATGEMLLFDDHLEQTGAMPIDDSPNKEHIIRGIRRLTQFRRAGDICIWGGNGPSGSVSFTFEFGAHSGWTDDETEAFIFSPAYIEHDFSRITRHAEFYDFFRRYTLSGDTIPEETGLEREGSPEQIPAATAA